MAEFKLGRIKFVWQGEWNLGNSYVVDDVVMISGQSYVCVRNHTAGVTDGTFAGDLNIVGAPKWELVSGGTEWTGDWQAEHYYNAGAVVKYGGRVYVCNTAHTSATNVTPTWLGLEADQNKWDVFAESINWRNGWQPSTKYSVNDFVSNDGYTYICNTAHISAATVNLGLEDDLSKWDVVNQGFNYQQNWVGNIRYHVNDLVKYGSSVWICTTRHVAGDTFDQTKWALFVEGLEFESSWNISTGYQVGDVVTYGGYSYIAKTNNIGSNPSTGLNAATDWAIYTTGFNFRGTYVDATAYMVGDVIRLNGYTYLCTADSTGHVPPNEMYWTRINSGMYWTNPETTYTAVSGTTLTGLGTSATFNVTRTNTKYTVTVANGGSTYVNGDTIKILGTSVGGLSPANDIVLTVTSENLGVIAAVSVNGFSSSWKSGTVYVLGDVTFWGANSYVCVAGHTAETANRPDNDSTAQYWNLLAAGAEEAVLTMTGDTVYYSETGPTRLPIGSDGQILRVRNGYPEWTYYGVINNVVYVAPTGTNSEETGWGLTIDKPWASVRYACDQVTKGYLNRQATQLLKKNKQFLMKEVTNWINYTYSVAVSAASASTNAFTVTSTANLSVNMPIQFSGTTGGVTAGTKYFVKQIIDATHFTITTTSGGSVAVVLSDSSVAMTGVLSYDTSYCERDTGLLVEAIIYDIGHGGTDEITKCAKAYYTASGSGYINANFGQQKTQTIAAYNYLKELVTNVLANTPPKRVYQVENGVYNGANQVIDTSLTAESGTGTLATTLLSIVTDGINAGEVTSIPASAFSNTTIFVKTGTYYEILPIVIPKNTAVVGDELRGTVVSPNRAIDNLVNDKPKTISALNRIKSVVANIVANNTVVPTAGNTDTQQYIYNNHESIVSSSVRSNVAIMSAIVTNGSTSAPTLTLTDPSNYDSGYSNARALIVGNTAFLEAEVTAFMNTNYSSLWSSLTLDQKTKCTRDIGYIVDALAYDLTYGGNLQTVVAARSYYSLGTFVEASNQKTAALAVQARLKAIIGYIVTKNTSWTKSTGNSQTQYTTGTAGSAGAQTFAETRIQEMYDCINTGTTPATIAPDTSWVSASKVAAHTTLQNAKSTIQAQVIAWIDSNYPDLVYNKTLCSRDVGYILDALCYDFLFGCNFMSVKAALSYYRALTSTSIVTTEQNTETVGTVKYIGLLAELHTAGTDVLASNLNTMTNILGNGTSVAPSYVYPDPTTYDVGYYNARRLVLANKQFMKDEVTAYMTVNYSSVWSGLGASGQALCTRDIGYIVDALAYDLTYGGNLATVIAARSYYSNGTFVEQAGEKTAAVAVQGRIAAIISDIAQGVAITRSTGNTTTQDTTGTAGSSAAGTFAAARITEVQNTINTGTEPTTIAPSLSWVPSALTTANTNILAIKSSLQTAATDWINETYPDLYYNKTTCQRDVGYIIDALRYDLMFGSNFLTIQNASSYYRSLSSTGIVLASQLPATLSMIGYIGGVLKDTYIGMTHSVGRIQAATRISNSADVIYSILQDGNSLAPSEQMPQPSNINANYAGAVNQIAQNYAFIKADISAYINANYTALWSSLGASGQAACQRDVGYILDALRYDLTYGGNTQTLIVGSSYYTYIDLVIASGEKTATTAAYTYLKSIIDNIVKGEASGTTWTKQAGNALSQTTTGSKDTVGDAATFAQNRVQDIIDWINNGVANATISPDTSWVDPSLVRGFTALQNAKAEIKLHGLGHVNKTHQDLSFNEATCSRDIGYMVDAMGYDMLFGGNFASTIVGKSYNRSLTSTAVVLANQKQASLDLIEFLKYKVRTIAVAGAVSQVATIINDIADSINGGATPALSWPDPSNITANYQAARTLISDNKFFIQEEIVAYMSANYPAVAYSPSVCQRDVGYIVDALHYDLTYGGNLGTRMAANAYYSGLTSALQIASSEKTATLAAYGYMKTLVTSIAQNSAIASPLQTNVAQVRGTGGSSTEANAAGALVQVVIDTITNISNLPAASNPSTSWVDSTIVSKQSALASAKATMQAAVISYIGTNYPNLVYNSSTCSRDVGLIIDAVGWDMVFNSNFQSVKAGTSYYRATAALVLSGQKFPTLDAMRYLKGLIVANITESATSLARAKAAMDVIITILENGLGATPVTVGTTVYNNTLGIANASELLRANKSFIASEATAWISYHFGAYTSGTEASTNIVTTATAHNLAVGDPIQFVKTQIDAVITATSSTGNLVTVKTTAGMYAGQKFATIIGSPVGNISAGTTYYIKQVVNSSQVVLSETYNGTAFNPGTASGGSLTVTVGGNVGTITTDTEYYVLTVPSTTTFTFGTVDGTSVTLSTDSGAIHVQYYYNETACRRDMSAYVDAIVEDLGWTGNYKSLYSAMVYKNAVDGSEMSDMYWVSNASGLRNQTMSGLSGQLTDVNDYGTKRPTAGAFVALNPGFGPYDSRVWVTSRSHYSQNCTMFGTGCVGAKIDSALHAGGNKSMVKNDFTTILSDGIGVWCTGSGSLTELVSVFNYYGYAGYLAEKGGRIRATNGNSSYGTYGVIAEGVDSKETPIYGTVNNRAYDAQISTALTDGVSKVLRLEFSNAGQNYTNGIYTVSGTGYNVDVVGDEFRDASIFETRIIDINNSEGYGGTNYASVANAAQTGDTTSITIAATDTALTNAYNGMRIQITGGTGGGQYANILNYVNGSKIAQVYKDSFATLTATAVSTTNNLITVSSTATLTPGMAIYFTSAGNGLSANTLYYVATANFSSTQFAVSLTGAGGTAVTITGNATGLTYGVVAAGWDHAVPGTTIKNALDLTTTYIIEPRISYTGPGYTATARTMNASTTWNKLLYGDGKFVAIPTTGTTTGYSTNGTSWATAGALSSSQSWIEAVYGGGEQAVATAIVGGLGGRGAVLTAVFGVPNSTGAATDTQIASVTVVDGGQGYTTPPVISFSGGGGSGAKATAVVLNGKIVRVDVTVPGSGYTSLPTVSARTDCLTKVVVNNWGHGYTSAPTITIGAPVAGATAWSSGGSATNGNYYYYTTTGITQYYQATSGGTFSSSAPVHTSGTTTNGTVSLLWVGTGATGTASRTITGVGTVDGVYEIILNDNAGIAETGATYAGFSGAGYTATPTVTILDSNAKYVAVATNGVNCYTTGTAIAAGTTWTAGTTMAGSPTISSLAYSTSSGVFVAVGGASFAYSSTNATSWTSRTIPTLGAGTYSAVAYGNKTFVAISTGSNATATSTNGVSWTAGGNLPSSTTWVSLAYGNGRWVAIASSSRSAAYSLDNGATWTAAAIGLPSSQSWTHVSYGQGLFFAVASGTSAAATSPDGINWTAVTMPSSSNWNDIQFGNPDNKPIWTAVSSTSGTIGASIRTGATALGRMKTASGVVTEVRMIEPGSGYPKGTVSATTTSTNLITVDDTTNLFAGQPIEFFGTAVGGLSVETTYFVVTGTITSTQFKVATTYANAMAGTAVALSTATASATTYRAGATTTVTDPNNVKDVNLRTRLGDGALGNPSFYNRGADYSTATGEVLGDGYSDLYQASTFLNVSGLSEAPQAGANVEFASLPGLYFKLVTVTSVLPDGFGNYTATFQVNPGLSVLQAPKHGDLITTRLKYSQVRLTGHDFLYIGTGGYTTTNFPGTPLQAPDTSKQELYSAGGRVFFTSTDQDGNFNVGNLFGVQQATGTATLNASAFNLSGLNSLQLGSVELGIGSAIITQFSTDPYFTANSDNIVPTQRAIKAYITSQIGGGQSSLNVNTLTSGVVYVAGNSISTTTGVGINVKSRMNFTGGIDGAPVALAYFMQK